MAEKAEDEEEKTPQIKWDILMKFISLTGGFTVWGLMNLSILAQEYIHLQKEYTMKSIHKEAKLSTDATSYAASVSGLPWRILKITLTLMLINKMRLLILLYVSQRLSKRMHDNIVSRVLHAPINLYFDITPVGKILNSFSRDLNATDHHTMRTFMNFTGQVYKTVATLSMACWIVP